MGAVPFDEWHLQLLAELRVARLATISASGTPHLVPVSYALHGSDIVFAVDEKPKASTKLARLRNIERDARVTVLFDRYSDDWTQLAWVRVDGRASVFARGTALPAALAALRERYPQYETMALEELPLIAIRPERVTGWRWAA